MMDKKTLFFQFVLVVAATITGHYLYAQMNKAKVVPPASTSA